MTCREANEVGISSYDRANDVGSNYHYANTTENESLSLSVQRLDHINSIIENLKQQQSF